LSSAAEHRIIEPFGRVGLHAGEYVLVDLHGESDAGVAEAFADHFDRDTFLEHESGMGVPRVVQSDASVVHASGHWRACLWQVVPEPPGGTEVAALEGRPEEDGESTSYC